MMRLTLYLLSSEESEESDELDEEESSDFLAECDGKFEDEPGKNGEQSQNNQRPHRGDGGDLQ
jgi:hypothetical protein